MTRMASHLAWFAVAVLGAFALGTVALSRGEAINALWIVVAAVAIYLVAYRYYSLFIATKVMGLDAKRATPAVLNNDGLDYVPTNKHILFGHHFAAIAGAGPLVGPVLAAQMGYLPGTLWLIAGVVFAGAVQDFMILFLSTRRNGRSLGDMVREEMGRIPGTIALFGCFLIMIIILAVLALIVVKALAESPWGMFTVIATLPIAMFMGVYMRYIRPGRIGEISLIGVVLLLASIWAGGVVAADPVWGPAFTFTGVQITWMLIGYGFVAAVLPVWLVLAPRDYLSTFLKIGTIIALAIGILVTMPMLKMPALTQFVDGTGPVWKGTLFPFLFITIACGAVSGFHALISSGTTPKLIAKETHARYIGYGAMLMESFVAIMAMVAASVIEPGVYFAMNSPAAVVGADAVSVAAKISTWGFVVTPEMLQATAAEIGEHTILARAGGAPTLAVGIAQIMHNVLPGENTMAFWYHFAILFEALFILTAVDAGTRAGRFMLQDLLGSFVPALKRTDSWTANVIGTAGCVALLGLVAVPGRGRSAGWHQHPLAAVRHLQPDARRYRPDARLGGPDQDETPALCLGHPGAGGMAADLHHHRQPDQAVRCQPGGRFPRPGQEVQHRPGPGPGDRAGQEPGPDAAHRLQRLHQRHPVGAVPGGGDEYPVLFHQGRSRRPGQARA
ncbi:carbon starvation protein CstA [Pseudomonas psychrotolerans]|nr:carbon starvation protein CstA [Pseudomonas psychrotolerans]